MSAALEGCDKCSLLDQRICDVVWFLTLAIFLLASLGMPWVGMRPSGFPDDSSGAPRPLWDLPSAYSDVETPTIGLVVVAVLAAAIVAAEDGVEPAVGAALVTVIIAMLFMLSLVTAVRSNEATTGPGLVITAGSSTGVAIRCISAARRRALMRAARSSGRSSTRGRP